MSRPNIEFKKGECFKCCEKWAPGHQCKTCTLHQIEGNYPDEEDNTDEEEVIAESSHEEGETYGEVILNDINCCSPPITLKLTATLNGKKGITVN